MYFDVRQVSELTGLSVASVRKAIYTGLLRTNKRSRNSKILITIQDIEKWISGESLKQILEIQKLDEIDDGE